MGKHQRDFKRIAMSARTAKLMVELFVDKTFEDHARKCDPGRIEPCIHESSFNLDVARSLEANLRISKKRATLDIHCPYSKDNPFAQKCLLKDMASRLQELPEQMHAQQRQAIKRISEEIDRYADRNAMQVIADAAT